MKEIAARVPLRYFKGHLSGSKTLHQQAKESKRATNNKEGHIKERNPLICPSIIPRA